MLLLCKTALIFCSLGSTAVAAPQTQSTNFTGVSQSTATAASAPQAARTEETAALRDDIRKMRLLVQQMENNLAFVSDTQSPLKHQFELEIQMWRMLIGQMERRLDTIEKH